MTPRVARALQRLVVTLVVVCAFAAENARSQNAADVANRIAGVQRALADWQLDEAAALAADLERSLPDVPPVQAVVGAVKFHQGDYDGAVRLLRRAAEQGGDESGLLMLAESTLKETQGSVSQSSEHFVVRTPPGKDELLAPIALWALEQAYTKLSASFDYRPQHKIVVDILHDAKGLASVSTLTEKEIETSGTIALCKFNRLMVTSPKALARGYSWLDTLSHELVHLIVSEKSHNNVPVWLHEGLAKFHESSWRGDAGLALDPASEGLLAKATKSGKLITFEQMHPSMAKLPSQEDTALAFAEVFTVVEYPEREVAPKRPGIRPHVILLEALRDGLSMDEALDKATGQKLGPLQASWQRYLRGRAFRLVPGAVPEKLSFVKNARGRTTNSDEQEDEAALQEADSAGREGRQYVRLANLLRAKRRLKAAGIEYEKAVAKIGVRSPALHNRLAGVYLETGDLPRAKKVLDDTVAVFPDDPQTHVLLGRLALRQSDWADARTHYQRATWEAPFNPEIHVALFKVGEAQQDDALKAQSRRALELLTGEARGKPRRDSAIALDSQPGGALSVSSTPWGTVFLDGVDLGLTTPLVDLRVRPGKHFVRVTDPLTGKEQGANIEVTDGKATRLQLTLEALSPSQRQALVAAEEALREKPEAPKAKPPAPVKAQDKPPAPWDDDDDASEFTPGFSDEADLEPIQPR